MKIGKELPVDEKLGRRNAIKPCLVSYMSRDSSLNSLLFKAKEQDSTLFCSCEKKKCAAVKTSWALAPQPSPLPTPTLLA